LRIANCGDKAEGGRRKAEGGRRKAEGGRKEILPYLHFSPSAFPLVLLPSAASSHTGAPGEAWARPWARTLAKAWARTID
jgi:hypothetical protein